ncbi:hypothetical protein [Actinomadura parmotrematis]|uniref:Phospholipid carrier-dependent glycosyltransferase n=1 Tax=Actinomadura parmotrematis TaxID=2864039 RepID=A0ABS7FN43_9ACTN|nr:hypothetical protein [Actinomadura parmotrematis]MBW8481645.1 hypothetical protein [Actinomadura parmotrematis]
MTGALAAAGRVRGAEPPGRARRAWALVRRHRVAAVLLVLAVALRVLAMLARRPGEVYWYDSYEYLRFALDPKPAQELHPGGYGMLLWLLRPFHSIALIVALQHLMGLAAGLLGYATLRRRGVAGWLAAVAMVPAWFDVELLHLEHAVLSDTPFMLLVTAAVCALLWSPRVSVRAAALAGLLLALSALVRTTALPLLGLVLVWLLLKRAGRRQLVALVAVAAVPVVPYAFWYHAEYGQYKLAGGDGSALWARTRTFADCAKIKPPPAEARLCPDPRITADAASEYFWIGEITRPPGRAANDALARSFALRAIRAQPLDYLHDVLADLSLTFAYPAKAHPKRLPPVYYFTDDVEPLSNEPTAHETMRAYDPSVRDTRPVGPWSGLLVAYGLHLPGPALGAVLLLGAYGVVRRGRGPGARLAVLLPWGMAVALLVLPVVVLDFDHRYVMPVLPVAGMAAALAFARRPLAAGDGRPVEPPGPSGALPELQD